jgi:RNA polymerase sigma-70 factor, ECF subfamily
MKEEELSDEFLMDAIAGKAMWALERLHERYSKRFYALAFRMTGDHMATEELVQDAFFTVWQSAASYSPQASPVHGWLFSIIYHRTIDHLRSMKHSSAFQQLSWQEVEVYERFFLSDIWDQVWNSVQNAELHTCIMQLPAEQREVIELAFFGGLTHCEIAHRCHMPLGTVKSRIRGGISQLRRTIEKEEVENTHSRTMHNEKATSGQASPVIVQATEGGCQTGFELYREGSCKCFGYTEWEHLIEQIEMFEFRGTTGGFIARKEKRAHGCVYWYAYTWGSTGRRKAYLGRPAELTLKRLEGMATKLRGIKK